MCDYRRIVIFPAARHDQYIYHLVTETFANNLPTTQYMNDKQHNTTFIYLFKNFGAQTRYKIKAKLKIVW